MEHNIMIFIKKNLYGIGLMFLTIFFAGSVIPYVYSDDTCIDCHKDIDILVQNPKLVKYYNYWRNSVHNLAGVECADCHGGNPTETNEYAAHKDNFLSFRTDSKESLKAVNDKCGKCHNNVLEHFRKSRHYKKLLGEKAAPNCITCHGSMNTEVFDVYTIAKGCEGCHNDETKHRPDIGKVARRVLGNINLLRVYREWLSNHPIYDEKGREELLIQYQDVILSWHTFNFLHIEERLQQPLEKVMFYIKNERIDLITPNNHSPTN
jgi:hypothetical protein